MSNYGSDEVLHSYIFQSFNNEVDFAIYKLCSIAFDLVPL